MLAARGATEYSTTCFDHLNEYRSVSAACQAIAPKVGLGAESLRRWGLQAQVDVARRPDVTTA
jgi:transposase